MPSFRKGRCVLEDCRLVVRGLASTARRQIYTSDCLGQTHTSVGTRCSTSRTMCRHRTVKKCFFARDSWPMDLFYIYVDTCLVRNKGNAVGTIIAVDHAIIRDSLSPKKGGIHHRYPKPKKNKIRKRSVIQYMYAPLQIPSSI